MDAETIRLILDMGASGADVKEVTDRLEQLRRAAGGVADSYEVLDRRAGAYSISTAQVDAETEKAVRAAVERTNAERALARALDDTDLAQRKAGTSAKGLGRAAIEGSRALQDLTQGGFAGILNNLEGLSVALGAGPGLAGLIAGVGVAAFLAKPLIDDWVKSMGPMKTKIPESTDEIDRLTDAIKRDRDAVEELRKKRELDFFEMEEYIKRTAALRREEEELARAREARQVGAGQSKAVRERASAFKDALAEYGGGEKLMGNLVEAGVPQEEAQDLVINAQRGGANAIQAIRRALAGRGDQQIGYRSPEQQRRDRLKSEQTDAVLRNNADKLRQRRQRDEQLNRQADANELAARNRAEADAKAAAKAQQVARPEEARMRAAVRGNVEAEQGRRAMQQLRQQGFDVRSPQEALQIMKAQQQQLERAQQDFVNATVAAASSGQGQQIQMLRQGARALRQRQQPMNNAGWN